VKKEQIALVKRAAGAAVALAIALALYLALMPSPVDVDIAKIGRETLRVTVNEEGKTRIHDIFVVTTPIAGQMERTTLKAGDPVIKDETVVAVVKPPEPTLRDFRTNLELNAQVKSCEANVDLAEAELRRAKAELDLTQNDYDRAKTLAAKGITPKTSLDKAQTNVRVQEETVKRAQAAIEVRKTELQNARARLLWPQDPNVRQDAGETCSFGVRSPESGRVLRLIAESEQALAVGAPILEIGDPANLEITVDLLSEDAVKVVPGANASIEGWGGPPLRAHVTRVEPSGYTKVSALGIEEQRVKTILTIDDPKAVWERLGHDYRVYVRIDIFKAEDVVVVPLGALFRRGDDDWSVFIVRDGRAHAQTVKLGHRNTSKAEVLDGLKEGDAVVLHPSDRVGDGVRVRERLVEIR